MNGKVPTHQSIGNLFDQSSDHWFSKVLVIKFDEHLYSMILLQYTKLKVQVREVDIAYFHWLEQYRFVAQSYCVICQTNRRSC